MEPSEYRGSQFSNQTERNNSIESYSHAVQLDASPTKDQAIIIHAIDDTSLQDYALAIGKLIGPKSIRYISKISNNRICAYLDKKEIVLHLTNLRKRITVNNNTLNLRPTLTPAQRIIFKRNNVKLCSRITTLKAGMADPEYAHILSFRRQAYIDSDDIGKIPSTFLITFEDTSYRIFTSIDSLFCFRCKQEGHLAKNCPLTQNSNITDTTIPNTNTTILTPTQSSKLPVKKIPITTEANIDNPKQATNKLPTEQPQIPFNSKRPLSQPSTDDKPDYVNSWNLMMLKRHSSPRHC